MCRNLILPTITSPGFALPRVIPAHFFKNHVVGGVLIWNSNVRSANAVSVTGVGTSAIKCEVRSLNDLQNSIILTPNGPKACPMAGEGLAFPAATRSRTTPLIAAIQNAQCTTNTAPSINKAISATMSSMIPLFAARQFSPKQLAIVRREALQVKRRVWYLNAILFPLILYTSYYLPYKYVRVQGRCESNWIQLNKDGSASQQGTICCSDDAASISPCYRGMELSKIAVSGKGAWVFPFLPLIFNYISVILGQKPSLEHIRVLTRRALLYAGIMLFRLMVLYKLFNGVEKRIVPFILSNDDAGTNCWYRFLRRDQKCVDAFDFSDHLILLVTHYIAIPLFEWFALAIESPRPWYNNLRIVVLRLSVFMELITAVYFVYSTTKYFHTPLENVIALVLTEICVLYPLYLLSQDRLANFVTKRQLSWLQLQWFVSPPSSFK